MLTDCLIIGYNSVDFKDYVSILKHMGTNHPDYRDLNLNFIEYNNKPYQALDLLSFFYSQNKKGEGKSFHNGDLMWMVIIYLGTYLSKRGLTFDYINLFQLEKNQLKEKLINKKFLTIVITTTIYNFDHPIIEIISFIKKYNDTAKIIIGGPYISKRLEKIDESNLQSIFKYLAADYYIFSREGEETLVNIIKYLKGSQNFDVIRNAAYKKGKDYILTSLSTESNLLEENLIDYSLFPKESYGEFLNLRVSKGCPYACSFCGFPQRTRKYMYASIDHIEKELNAIRDIGTVKNLFFIDDTLNVPKSKFKKMLRMMIKQKYNFKWHCFFRCKETDEEAIDLMTEAGCEGVFLGIESANDTILENMNKKARKKDFLKAIPLLKKKGILVFASIVVGFPGETEETFQETMDFLEETKPDFYRPQLWFCDPVTPIWSQREKYGLKGYHFGWSHNTMDAKKACSLMEKAFLAIDTPIWVPDPGFNFVSLYYLKQKGMTLEQIKIFLKCFNAIVREKLLNPNKKEISQDLFENLKISCQFDNPRKTDIFTNQIYSGKNFTSAQNFWINEFATNVSSSQKDYPSTGFTNLGNDFSKPYVIDKSLLNDLSITYNVSLSDIFLSAYSTLLLHLKGYEDTTFAVSIEGKEVFPLRLYPLWTISFKDLIQATKHKIQLATNYCSYSSFIFTNQLQISDYKNYVPIIKAAYVETEQGEVNLDELIEIKSAMYKETDLILILEKKKEGFKIQFRCFIDSYMQNYLDKLDIFFISILRAVNENQNILLNEINLESQRKENNLIKDEYENIHFNFKS